MDSYDDHEFQEEYFRGQSYQESHGYSPIPSHNQHSFAFTPASTKIFESHENSQEDKEGLKDISELRKKNIVLTSCSLKDSFSRQPSNAVNSGDQIYEEDDDQEMKGNILRERERRQGDVEERKGSEEDKAHEKKKIKKKDKGERQSHKKGKERMSNNALAFFWAKIMNYLQKIESIKDGEWSKMSTEGASLFMFTQLFNYPQLQQPLSEMFESRYLLREILYSAVRLQRKKLYPAYVKVLQKGFKKKQLKFLN